MRLVSVAGSQKQSAVIEVAALVLFEDSVCMYRAAICLEMANPVHVPCKAGERMKL